MTKTATERVRAALASGQAPLRKDLEHSLREAWGLSARKARAIAAGMVPALGAVEDASDEIAERVAALERALRL